MLDARELLRTAKPVELVFTASLPHPVPGGPAFLEFVRAEVERLVQSRLGAGARVEVRK